MSNAILPPSTSPIDAGRRGRGKGRGGRGNRNRRGPQAASSGPIFKGDIPEMEGYVFQTAAEGAAPKHFDITMGKFKAISSKFFKTSAGDFAPFFKDLKIPQLPHIPDLNAQDQASESKKRDFLNRVDRRSERQSKLELCGKSFFTMAWGQCSHPMRAKLKSLADFDEKETEGDCEWLLKQIRGVCHNFEEQHCIFVSLHRAELSFLSFKQNPGVSLSSYLEDFKTRLEVYEHHGGAFGIDPGRLKAAKALPWAPSDPAAAGYDALLSLCARDRSLAVNFVMGADPVLFGNLQADLQNQFARGNDQFPKDLVSGYNMLVTYEPPSAQRQPRQGASQPRPPSPPPTNDDELSFAQRVANAPVPGNDGIVFDSITCFECQANGHYANRCPNRPSDPSAAGLSLLQVGNEATNDHFTFFQRSHQKTKALQLPSTWVLLDSESTVSIFHNPALLKNVRASPTSITVHGSGGHIVSRLIGDIPNFGSVWVEPKSLANILSLAAVRKVCRVTMDSNLDAAFSVHKKDGTIMKFMEHPSGLYYHDTSSTITSSPSVSAYSMLTTVEDNKRHFTRREIQGADRARELYRKLGRPSEKSFQHYLTKNLVRNSPVTAEDAKRALVIYGPEVATLKGKTTWSRPPHKPTIIPSCLPDFILQYHLEVTLCMDLFYVSGLCFFTTISRGIKFRTVEFMMNKNKASLQEYAARVINLYRQRGFNVTNVHADGAFACIRHDLAPAAVSITAADDHVADVERSIRTIKERTRATVHGMPYSRLPKEMVKGVVAFGTSSLNLFPPDDGISDDISPLTIVTGAPNPDFNQMKLEFGDYCAVFEDNHPTNTQSTRVIDAIAMQHSGNVSGDYHFLNIRTGKRITRRQYTKIPISRRIIEAVEALAYHEGQQPITGAGLLFEWGPNYPVLDEEIIDIMDDAEVLPENMHANMNDEIFEPVEGAHERLGNEDYYSDEELDGNPDQGPEQENDDDPTQEAQGAPEDTEDVDLSVHDDDDESLGDLNHNGDQPRYNLRTNRDRSYAHRFDHQMDTADDTSRSYDVSLFQTSVDDWTDALQDTQHQMFCYVFHQMSVSAGIKKHGQAAIDALFREFCQFQDKKVFRPMDPTGMTRTEKKAALRAVNLIKEKRTGDIKARSCADGSKQRGLYDKADTSSPTLSTDALMLSLVVDAFEKRDVATADVAGAYLNADMKDFVVVRVDGDAVDIMVKVNPKYEGFVTVENGRRVLYLRLLKALYGCVQSALLWYKLFSTKLEKQGFVLNPYDPCVGNKIIDGSQCTVCWYVDDTKISHVDPNVVTNVIKDIEANFGGMSVVRGKEHMFLGMNICFDHDNGTVKIKMTEYIRESIESFGDDVSSGASSPASKSLFTIDTASPELSPKKAALYHSIVAKLLYVSNRGRSDIAHAIAFLTTRVSVPLLQDWAKLGRLLRYLHDTIDFPLILGAKSLTKMTTWVDASYAVHPDMRSHTGGCTSLGRGVIMAKSSKQKLNTKSSTEAEVVGASDYLPNNIWARNFMGAQGYDILENSVMQDNQSAMRLEMNGRVSAGQKSRHIDIRYFFIKDRINNKELAVVYCPTEAMLADFYTKPLQGALFRKFRSVILGHEPITVLQSDPLADPEERVEGNKECRTLASESYESNPWISVTRKNRGTVGVGARCGRPISFGEDRTEIENRKNLTEMKTGGGAKKKAVVDRTSALTLLK